MRSHSPGSIGEEAAEAADSACFDEDVAALALLLHKGGGLVHGTDCRTSQSRVRAEACCGVNGLHGLIEVRRDAAAGEDAERPKLRVFAR